MARSTNQTRGLRGAGRLFIFGAGPETFSPEQVISEIGRSGLRGRGGAGFPTGTKCSCVETTSARPMVAASYAMRRGRSGRVHGPLGHGGKPPFGDRGMIIGAFAMGIHQGFVYIRAEYPLAVREPAHRPAAGEAAGCWAGCPGNRFRFQLSVRLGAGAFVCGEETALMASIEGRIGEPHPRPPYPAEAGLWGKPTNINNVKTWAQCR